MTVLSYSLYRTVHVVSFPHALFRQNSNPGKGGLNDSQEFHFEFFIWVFLFILAVIITKILQIRFRRSLFGRSRRTRLDLNRSLDEASTLRRSGLSDQPPPLTKPIQLESVDAPKDVEDDLCAVCLSPLHELPVSRASCPHWLHSKCYHAWLVKDSKHACPVCRTAYDEPVATEG